MTDRQRETHHIDRIRRAVDLAESRGGVLGHQGQVRIYLPDIQRLLTEYDALSDQVGATKLLSWAERNLAVNKGSRDKA